MLSANDRFLKRYGIIRSYISFTQECGMVFKFERFSYISCQSFGLGSFRVGSFVELRYLSLVLSEGFLVS